MNKTLKKTLSIILTILMIVTTVPFAFAAGDGTPLTIDLIEVTASYITIGNGRTYYDEDGYIITGTNKNVTINIYDSCDITFSNMSAMDVNLWGDSSQNVTVTLDGDNYMYGAFNVSESHLTINGDADDTLTIVSNESAFYTGGKPGTLTVNGGKINAVTEATNNYPTIDCYGGFTLNGGEVTASNNYFYVIDNKTVINGGTLNVISISSDLEAINTDVKIAKGALLTVSATYKVFNTNYNITPINEAEENLLVFARFDTDSDFAPVYDINAIEDKTYAEIKVDTHEHDLDNSGKCACGYSCPHESITDGKCDNCGTEGKFVTITMTDRYNNGWTENAVVIEQLIDGTYTEVATATIENGNSGTFAIALPEDGIYAFSWVEGRFSDECSFTVTVNGETVYEAADGSKLKNGQIIYVLCEHSFEEKICTQCNFECGVDFEHEITDSICTVCGSYIYAITHQPTEEEPYVELNDDTDASYQWYSVVDATTEITDENASGDWQSLEAPFNNSVYEDGKWIADNYDDLQYYFMVDLEADDTINFEFASEVEVIIFGIDGEEKIFIVENTKYSITVREAGTYWLITPPVDYVRAYISDRTYTAIDGETAAELQNPEFGKKYACEATFADGTKEMSDEFKYVYAITHQPTEAEPYVELNDDTDATYQWYKVEEKITDITDENASTVSFDWGESSYDKETGWTGVPYYEGYYGQDFFTASLKAGETVTVEVTGDFTNSVGLYDYDTEEDIGVDYIEGVTSYELTVEKDGNYTFYTFVNSGVVTVKATFTKTNYTKVEGQTAATLFPAELGEYACEVTYGDGTKETSETFEATTVHTCDFSDEWKYDGTKHWKECACGLTAEEANHEFEDYTVTTPADCENNAWETGYCECGATDEREVPDSVLGHTPSGWWAKNETEHWRHCVNDSCSEEIEGTRAAHTFTWKVTTDATATEDGEETGTCECGYETTRSIPATGGTTDPEPGTPDVPTDGNCDHMCHKTGFVGFIWKIISFLQRFFGIQQYCDCGELHYEKAIFG